MRAGLVSFALAEFLIFVLGWNLMNQGYFATAAAIYVIGGLVALVAGVRWVDTLNYQASKYKSAIVAVAVFASAATGGLLWVNHQQQEAAEAEKLKSNEGVLEPPEGSIGKQSMTIHVGTNVGTFARDEMVLVRVVDKDLATVRRTQGGIVLDCIIYSEDGRVVAEIRGNEFTVNQNNVFRIDRKTSSDLTVFDQRNASVLSVELLDSTTMKLTGVFRYKDQGVLITEDFIRTSSRTVHRSSTFTNWGVLITIDKDGRVLF